MEPFHRNQHHLLLQVAPLNPTALHTPPPTLTPGPAPAGPYYFPVPWQEINPRYVRQDHPNLRAVWYRDTSPRGGGELILWLDARDRVVAFQLTLEEWPSLDHLVADWQEGSALRIGTVDEEPQSSHPGVRPAPILRFPESDSSSDSATRLLAYFRENATAIKPNHRTHITSILSESAA